MAEIGKINIPEPFAFTGYEIILTWDCNLTCSYCYEKNNGSKEKTSGHFLPETVDQLIAFIIASHDKKAPEIHLQFFGGEPTLQLPTIKTIIAKLETNRITPKLTYGMTTNATNITREDAQYFAQKNFGLLVSLDGTQEVHDRNRGSGTFEKTMQAIAYMRALNIAISLRMTIAQNTIADFSKSFELVNSLGLPFLWQLDTSKEYAPETTKQFILDLQKLYTLQRPVFDTTMQRFKDHLNSTGYCINPYKNISVLYDGSLIICSRVNWPLGNIWQGINNYDQVTELSIYGGSTRPECSGCLSLEYCKGGCLGEHVENKTVWAVEYTPKQGFCLTQHIMQIVFNEALLQKHTL